MYVTLVISEKHPNILLPQSHESARRGYWYSKPKKYAYNDILMELRVSDKTGGGGLLVNFSDKILGRATSAGTLLNPSFYYIYFLLFSH